jgi:endonuclease/exonuclease/phosphatase family metal-dependent hydrolase
MKPAHKGEHREGEEWRRKRHRANIRRIIRENPDVVLLQEMDVFLMPDGWEGGMLPCGLALNGYAAFCSYSATGRDSKGPAEGVAILLRKGVWEVDPAVPVAKFAKTKPRGGKCGLTLHARRSHDHAQKCAFSTVHLQFDKDASPSTTSEGKLTNLHDALGSVHENMPVVLAGDFNTM